MRIYNLALSLFSNTDVFKKVDQLNMKLIPIIHLFVKNQYIEWAIQTSNILNRESWKTYFVCWLQIFHYQRPALSSYLIFFYHWKAKKIIKGLLSGKAYPAAKEHGQIWGMPHCKALGIRRGHALLIANKHHRCVRKISIYFSCEAKESHSFNEVLTSSS